MAAVSADCSIMYVCSVAEEMLLHVLKTAIVMLSASTDASRRHTVRHRNYDVHFHVSK